MYRTILIGNLLFLASASLAIGGPIKGSTLGSEMTGESGCNLYYCVAPGFSANGYVVWSSSKTVKTSFGGATAITTGLPTQFTTTLRQGSLNQAATDSSGSGTPASSFNSSTQAHVGQQGDTTTYVLNDGQVQQRGTYTAQAGNSGQAVISSLPLGFSLYSTSIVANSIDTKNTKTTSSAPKMGTLSALYADPMTGGTASAASDQLVLPTVDSGSGNPVAISPSGLGGTDPVAGGDALSSPLVGAVSSDVMTSEAPEPSAEVMLGIGLVAIGFATRITRKSVK